MELHLPYHLPIRSRIGCWILAVAGALVSLASATLLIYSIIATWGYAGLIEYAMHAMLLGMTFIGVAVTMSAWRGAHR